MSLYHATIPVFRQMLGALSTIIDKAFVRQFHSHYGLPPEDDGPLA